MKMSTLEYFIVLAESKSINQAAQDLYITQPCLTRAIQSMEKELGIQLFHRDSSGVTLTEMGQRILPEAKQAVRYYRGWKELGKEVPIPQIDIYSQSVFSLFLLPDILLRFRRKHPNVAVNLTSVLKPERHISRDVHNPVLALTVCNDNLYEKASAAQGNKGLPLMEGEYHCILNAKNPLANRETISFEELREMYFVFTHTKGLTEAGWTGGALYSEFFKIMDPSHIIEVESLSNVIALMCKNTEGCSFAYYPMLTAWDAIGEGKLVHIPVRGQKMSGAACLFYEQESYRQHPVVRELVTDIKETARAVEQRAREKK